MALLCSVSLLLSFIEFPLIPAAPFLKYDASFVPMMIAGFAYGPGPGIAVGVVQIALHGLFMGDLPGSIMNIVVCIGFIWPASMIYARMHNKRGAFIGLLVSTLVSTACALLANLVITPLYMGVTIDAIIAMLVPIFLPFNLIKAAINSVLTAAVYKATSNVIKPKHERTPAKLKSLPAIEPLEPTDTAIVFDNVSYAYDGSHNALDGVSLSIPTGEFVCILGGNGSGKSTLTRHINALFTPDSGEVRIFGVPTSEQDRTYSIRSSAGLVFQSPHDQLVAGIVEEDVAFGPENLGVPSEEIAERVKEALELVGMSEFAEADVSTLSGGQCQRVAIAGVLAMRPSIIVFDEASSMLDPQGRMDLLRIALNLHEQGFTVLMVTHDLEEARLADRIIVLQDGKLVADGTPDQVLSDATLLKDARLNYSLDELFDQKARG